MQNLGEIFMETREQITLRAQLKHGISREEWRMAQSALKLGNLLVKAHTKGGSDTDWHRVHHLVTHKGKKMGQQLHGLAWIEVDAIQIGN